jgi:hypothetical protein
MWKRHTNTTSKTPEFCVMFRWEDVGIYQTKFKPNKSCKEYQNRADFDAFCFGNVSILLKYS